MKTIFFTENYFNSIQKNVLLTLEQAQWFAQDEGYIPIPKNCKQENTHVIFTKKYPHYLFIFKHKKIKRYRISQININGVNSFEYIIAIELEDSTSNSSYYFDTFNCCNFIKSTNLSKVFSKSKIRSLKENSECIS